MTGEQYDIDRLPQYIEELKLNTPTYLTDFAERKYKPSELGISARNINNWSDNELLPLIKKKGWHKFNLTECVWLKVILHLRELNLKFDAIRSIKEQIFTRPDLVQIMEENDVFNKIKGAFEVNDFGDVSEIVDSNEFKESLIKEKLRTLDVWIIDLIVTRSNYRLLFNNNGELMIYKDNYNDYLQSLPEYNQFIKTTHVSVSLNQILFEITNELIEDDELAALKILTKEESKIIDLIRVKGTKKVEILFSLNDSPQLIKITSQNKLDSATRVKELIMGGGYQEIKITTENGKVVNFENTKKIRLKSDTV